MTVAPVAIVGAGPTGLAVGIELKRRGIPHVVFDKGALVDSIRRFPVNMVFFTTPELLEIGDLPLVTAQEKPVRLEALKYYRKVTEYYGLAVRFYEKVDAVRRTNGAFTVATPRGTYDAQKVVVATGYYDHPNLLGVPGEELKKVSHYYTEAHPYFGHDVAVVGGANSAAEAALDLFRSGARVSLIHRGTEVSRSIKYWVRPDIENRLERGEIRAFFETKVVEIREKTLVLEKAGATFELKNDFVLALTGYHTDTAFLGAMGVAFDANGRPEHDPETLETNVPGLYLAGSVTGGRDNRNIFIENGRFHGKRIAEHVAARL